MTELEQLLDKARQLAEARNHRLLPFVRRGSSAGSRCVTCGRQVYVMPDPGLIGAAIGGDAIAEMCIRKPSVSVKAVVPKRKTRLKRRNGVPLLSTMYDQHNSQAEGVEAVLPTAQGGIPHFCKHLEPHLGVTSPPIASSRFARRKVQT